MPLITNLLCHPLWTGSSTQSRCLCSDGGGGGDGGGSGSCAILSDTRHQGQSSPRGVTEIIIIRKNAAAVHIDTQRCLV